MIAHCLPRPLAALIFCAFVSIAQQVAGDPWPAWRGPEGTGVSHEKNLPTHWSRTENIRWRTPLVAPGNSTPIIWSNRVYITEGDDSNATRTLRCFSTRDGSALWHKTIHGVNKDATHETNPPGSGSPVTDGERVIAWFGSAGIHCYDVEGRPLWKRDLGLQEHLWGYGSSPVIHRNLCLLNFGPGERSTLIAFDKKTGETLWKVEEPGGKFGKTSAEWIGSWSTPLFIRTDGKDQIIQPWPKRVAGIDPEDGTEIWTCAGLNPLIYTSPLYSQGIVVVMGGFNGSALAVKADGRGDVTTTHRLWHQAKTKQRIGSGVVAGDHIYILDDPGVAECLELKTGKVVWEERLRGPGKTTQSWASMVLADQKLYVVNHSGDAFVLKADPQFTVVSTNSIGERTLASMAVSDGNIFLRSYQALYCVGAQK